MASSLLLLRPPQPPPPRPHSSPLLLRNLPHIPSNFTPRNHFLTLKPSLSVATNALTESSDSPKSLDPPPDPQPLLQELADCFNLLSSDYFSKLPRDLRLDLNDAAFDLSNGPVVDQCGQELGMTLLNISRAWESADTSTSTALVNNLPLMVNSLTGNNKSALGKRLLSAGSRFQSMGQYGQGELQRISKAMISTGKLLSSTPVSEETSKDAKDETRMFKFGELQVELTREKAYIGAAIGVVYGIISWELSQGIQNVSENSLQYANDNASLVAQSLRGTLLIVFSGSTVLSGFATIGLLFLAQQLKSEKK